MHLRTDGKAETHTDMINLCSHYPGMPSYRESAVDYLREVIRVTGRSASELAELIDVSHTTFTRPLKNPEYKYAPKFPKLQKLSEMTGVPLPETLVNLPNETSGSRTNIISLPIRGKVAAGVWIEADLLAEGPMGYAPMVSDPLYGDAEQWADLIEGPSMNRHYKDGDYVHVVELIGSGHRLTTGDHVIVQRTGADGKIERTCKLVEITDGRMIVRGDSTEERWNVALDVAPAQGLADVEITGLVIGSYRPRRRRH